MDDVMTDDQGGMLRFERVLDAPVETVWAWLTEPEKRKLWFADGPMDLREGGAVELVFDHDHLSVDDVPYPEDAIRWKGVTSRERVVAIDPPRLLAMTWDGGKNGVARFELTPEGEATRLVLTHTGIGDPGHRKGTAAGWRSHLAVLAGRLSGQPVRDFWKLHAESMKAVFGG
ncbi:SRPBCC family protein [Hephaestia sp. GCM10023244]|uniref:SRPBCC family protein n=1 Tax=unclassified Hephaestia TaxID=2631281 RepID=UPI0020772676|nr:SRPBCC family protein [Hephaestia sp. MAHUQ-44]MCM8731702.1 SRPBCC family protein [Hephaestia sp. MAHUQ-44]